MGSGGPALSLALAVHKWDRCWGRPTRSPGSEPELEGGLTMWSALLYLTTRVRSPVLPHLVLPTPRTAGGQGQLSSSHALGAGSPSPMPASGASSAVFLRQGTGPSLPNAAAREAQEPTSSLAFMTLGLALLPAMGRGEGRGGDICSSPRSVQGK